MNWIAKAGYTLTTTLVIWITCNGSMAEVTVASQISKYQVRYTVLPQPQRGTLEVSMRVTQPRRLLRELRFVTADRISGIKADGELLESAGEIVWRPPASGGTLRWTVNIASRRNSNGYDAWLGEDWGLMRAEDLIPRASTRTVRNSASETSLQFSLPSGWSVVTAYASRSGVFSINKAERRFDQPDGWIVMGRLGIRHETIAGIRVVVAAPIGQDVRRLDILALLNWTLPELSRVIPELPRRLAIVSAGDPMWRGGLSAPQSLYIHAERPLISENATSTLLHEVMHSTVRLTSKTGYDWIVEGLAEYYSLELLRRSGSISNARHEAALKNQLRWAKSASVLCQRLSSGPATAMAVGILAALDAEIRSQTDGESSLDDLLEELHGKRQPVDLLLLQEITRQLIDSESGVLAIDKLPGCREYRPVDPGNG
ncbi:MAG: hypothetical protein OEW64_02725 [Gammaproteobacteria bacterium]|nr:hypothetical protein [Gammaproteobacteria bacterium]MDH5302993.1 hypothetical protein [Gammaproteobacteria bacterium]MDH5321260.1 hypothetical protein [Gammaproteobacteria bacterium]